MKKIITILIVIIIIILGFFLINGRSTEQIEVIPQDRGGEEQGQEFERAKGEIKEAPEASKEPIIEEKKEEPVEKIGNSAGLKSITAYHFGDGDTELLFIGGTHGAYSWNTAAVAYELIEYLDSNPSAVPENVKVTVIPVLNPDGLHRVVDPTGPFSAYDVNGSQSTKVAGRFNGNGVDLNRNFDCDWQPQGVWQDKPVNGGPVPFSEPESKVIRDYVAKSAPDAVVVWYSAAGGVFASSCHNGVLAETLSLTNMFAQASGYKAYNDFDFYEVTGDMVNWFAKKEIPAISVLLSDHENVEWDKNKAGIEAILEYYAK